MQVFSLEQIELVDIEAVELCAGNEWKQRQKKLDLNSEHKKKHIYIYKT